MTTDLAQYTYGDLVAALRKDLLLDATTDVLPGTVFSAVENDAGSHGTVSAADKHALLASLGGVLAVAGLSKVSAGQATATWAGGSSVSGVLTASTGFTGSVVAVAFSVITSASGFSSYGGLAGNALGSFTYYAVATAGSPPAADHAAITWIAVA